MVDMQRSPPLTCVRNSEVCYQVSFPYSILSHTHTCTRMFIREKRRCTLGTAHSHSAASMDVYIFVIDPRVYRHMQRHRIYMLNLHLYTFTFLTQADSKQTDRPKDRPAGRPTGRPAGRRTGRTTDGQAERQTDTYTHTHIQNTYLPTYLPNYIDIHTCIDR